MSSFWKSPLQPAAQTWQRMNRSSADSERALAQCPEFPLEMRRITNLVRTRHEVLAQPAEYFIAVARRMHGALPSSAWLTNLRLLQFSACDESECFATWIYAKYYRSLEAEEDDPTLAKRPSILAELEPEYLALRAVAAAERAVRELGAGPSQTLLLPLTEARILIEALECSAASSIPRWLAFSSTALKCDGALPLLDSVLQLRSMLEDAGDGTADSRIGKSSEELVRRTAAAWLADRAPSIVLLTGKERTSLYDAVMLHDARNHIEDYVALRRGAQAPEWLCRELAHTRLERQVGAVIDLALEFRAERASCLAPQHGHEASEGADQRAPSMPSALDQLALMDALGGIMWGDPRSVPLADALRLGADDLGDSVEAAAPLADASRTATRPGTKKEQSNGHSHRLRALSLIGVALRMSEIRAHFADSDANGPAEDRALAGRVDPETGEPADSSRDRDSTASRDPVSEPLCPADHACIPLHGLLRFVKWLGSSPSSADGYAYSRQTSAHRTPPASGGGFVPAGYPAPKPTRATTSPRVLRSAELSVARGLRFVAGEHLPIIDACIAVLEQGIRATLPQFAALRADQFRLLMQHLPLPSYSADEIRLGLLRTNGTAAIALMPEFAREDATTNATTSTNANAWVELWLRAHPQPSQPNRSNAARMSVQFTPEEIAQLPAAARRAYFLGYIQRFGEEAASNISADGAEPRKHGRTIQHESDETELSSYLAHIAQAVDELPFAVVRQHVPIRALAAALPQASFDRLDLTDLEVADLFGYGGPKARVVWTHAWRRLSKPIAPSAGSPAAEAGADGAARAAVLRALELGRFTLSNLRVRAPESSGGDQEGDVARLMLSDPAIARELMRQIATVDEIAFLVRVGGDRVLRDLDDAAVAQLVLAATGGEDADRLTKLLSEAARRMRTTTTAKSAATTAATTASATASAARTIDRSGHGSAIKICATVRVDDRSHRLKSDHEALVAVQLNVRDIAARVCACEGGMMRPAPIAEPPRGAVAPQPSTATPGGTPPGMRRPILYPPQSQAEIATSLLRIIGLSSGRCEIPLDLIQRLVRLTKGRSKANLMRGASIGRKRQRREAAASGKSVDDALSTALELAQEGLADEFPQLVDACLSDSLDGRYITHRIQKKRGGIREINEPDADLKRLQRKILMRMLSGIPLSRNAHGFVRGRGTKTNATAHARQRVVLNVDIRNFFGSLPIASVRAAIAQARRGRLSPAAIDLLVKIVTREGALPQGAPTSPVITNIALRHADGILNKAAHRVGIRYTRYADDLTFSGADGPVQRIVPLVRDVLRPLGLELHPDKTHVYRSGRRQLVTGLVVNERPNLPRRDRRKLRAAAHALARGLTMHWNGADMSRSSFEGRLAYLATVSRRESNRLRAQVGLPELERDDDELDEGDLDNHARPHAPVPRGCTAQSKAQASASGAPVDGPSGGPQAATRKPRRKSVNSGATPAKPNGGRAKKPLQPKPSKPRNGSTRGRSDGKANP